MGSCRRRLHRRDIDPHSGLPLRLMCPLVPLKVRGARYRSDLNAWQENDSPAAKATNCEARRSVLEARIVNTSSCVLRVRCPVANSSPLQALTFRPPESDHGTDHGTAHAPHRTGPRSDRAGGSSATLPSANCTTQDGGSSNREEEGLLDRLGRPRTERSKVTHSWMTQPR